VNTFALPAAPLLLLVSDRARYGPRTLEEVFLPALDGGVNMLQLREPTLPARGLVGEGQRLRRLALGGVPLLVHDRVDAAVAIQADGVHVPADGLPIGVAKDVGRGMLVGTSVSSVTAAVAAESAGADYLVVEPVFPGHYSYGRSPVGASLVGRIKSRVRIPILAGGGITAGNAHQVIAAGADGVSVITEIVAADDPRAAARRLMQAMRQAWDTHPLLRDALA
jgi:thiamine-phosphate pyrophosphorylase